MPIADWFISKSDPSISVHLEIGSPIAGTGSLRMANTGSLAPDNAHVRLMAGPPDSQFLKGKVRTLLKTIAATDGATTVNFMGCLGMMSQANVWDVGGQAYFAGRWGGASTSWWIARVDNGITGAGDFTMLASGSTVGLPLVAGPEVPMEFEWVYDPLEFNGVRLILRAGGPADFSGMSVIYTIVDPEPTALSASVGEGLFMSSTPASPGPLVEVLFDKTTVFELVPV